MPWSGLLFPNRGKLLSSPTSSPTYGIGIHTMVIQHRKAFNGEPGWLDVAPSPIDLSILAGKACHGTWCEGNLWPFEASLILSANGAE